MAHLTNFALQQRLSPPYNGEFPNNVIERSTPLS